MTIPGVASTVPTVQTSDGVAIGVHDLGGGGIPVVLAHATGMHGLVWRALVEQLGTGWHYLAFDARGHGDSGACPDVAAFSWNELSRDVLAVVDGLGLVRPIGIGHSSGATALLLAEQDRPGLFRGLYCYEPVIVPVDPPLGRDPDNALAAAARRRRRTFASRQEASAHYTSKPPLSALAPAVLKAYVDQGFAERSDGSVELKCRAEHEATVYETATDHACFAGLSRIECPVMIAAGDASVAFAPAALHAQVSPLPNGRLEVFNGLGHLGPLEAPSRVARSVSTFLSELSC